MNDLRRQTIVVRPLGSTVNSYEPHLLRGVNDCLESEDLKALVHYDVRVICLVERAYNVLVLMQQFVVNRQEGLNDGVSQQDLDTRPVGELLLELLVHLRHQHLFAFDVGDGIAVEEDVEWLNLSDQGEEGQVELGAFVRHLVLDVLLDDEVLPLLAGESIEL